MKVKEAIYCWKPDTGEAKLVRFPDVHKESDGFWTGGAVWTEYRHIATKEQVTAILMEACQSVIRDGILPDVAFKAVMGVDEVNAMFAEDVPYKKETKCVTT